MSVAHICLYISQLWQRQRVNRNYSKMLCAGLIVRSNMKNSVTCNIKSGYTFMKVSTMSTEKVQIQYGYYNFLSLCHLSSLIFYCWRVSHWTCCRICWETTAAQPLLVLTDVNPINTFCSQSSDVTHGGYSSQDPIKCGWRTTGAGG